MAFLYCVALELSKLKTHTHFRLSLQVAFCQ